MVFSRSYAWPLALASLFCASACDPVTLAVGTGVVVGAAAAEDRGVSGVYSDTKIRTQINYRWLKHESILMDRLTLSVQDGQVVLTGVVEEPALKEKAVSLIQDVPGITHIIDEIKIGPPETFNDYSRDAWITTKVRSQIFLDKKVASRNYSIRTVGRVVYIMGTAKDSAELARVVAHASSVSGVKEVINYTAVKD
ncbi:BON domain-containing protein [bacterium NHP-B]|nr:BON domain-containing protein [bacterium NHP-B]